MNLERQTIIMNPKRIRRLMKKYDPFYIKHLADRGIVQSMSR
ncbi:MAG: hypothetical protein JWN15_4227 [Firmicutes bacterium]|nr:hypothetical protein [Bacillota bacterium]